MNYICPKCSTEFIPNTKFCDKCGCNLEMEFIETPTCPVCKKEFPIGTIFCSEDGAKLESPKELANPSYNVSNFGVLAGTVGVIFFSLFSWVEVSRSLRIFGGIDLGSTSYTLFNLSRVNTFWGIFAIGMLVCFVLLIASLFRKPQKAKSALAYQGFENCAGVTVAVIILTIFTDGWTLTVFPFLTLAVSILALIFAVKVKKRPSFLDAVKELQINKW